MGAGRLDAARALDETIEGAELFLCPGNRVSRPWGALTRSHAAAASYSWISPPSRSRRRIATADPAGLPRVEGTVGGSGGCRASAWCGLCSL